MEAVMDEPTSGEATGPQAPVPGVDVTVRYGRRRQAMVRLARILTGSFEIAEELVQEAFVKLQLTPTVAQNPDAYLRTIVTNLSWGYLRRLRLERALRPDDRIVVPAPEVDETWAVVCRLPFRQRAVLALRYYEDLPEAEIADILGCRLGTVKSAHHRALATLRRELS
jgi:RNA polymerase sigma factor (sigma-70 family)